MAEERKETECPICMEEMGVKKVIAGCSHTFCIVCIINFIKSERQFNRQSECPTCRQKLKFIMIANEQGPSPVESDFVKAYNRKMVENTGPITFIENLPFAAHRFMIDIKNSSGLILLEKPLFYVVTLSILHFIFDITEIVSFVVFFLIDLFDDIGFVIFILMSLGGQFIAFMRDRRLQREL